MWYNTRRCAGWRRGQAVVEYVLALAAMLAVATVFGLLVIAAANHAERSEDLVTADCP